MFVGSDVTAARQVELFNNTSVRSVYTPGQRLSYAVGAPVVRFAEAGHHW